MNKLIIAVAVLLLSSCAATQNEKQANKDRLDSWEAVNTERTYTPVKITGITMIRGDNITIETTGELSPVPAPDLQWDTSDTELAGKAVNVLGLLGGAYVISNGSGTRTEQVGGDYVKGYQSNPSTVTETTTTLPSAALQ